MDNRGEGSSEGGGREGRTPPLQPDLDYWLRCSEAGVVYVFFTLTLVVPTRVAAAAVAMFASSIVVSRA